MRIFALLLLFNASLLAACSGQPGQSAAADIDTPEAPPAPAVEFVAAVAQTVDNEILATGSLTPSETTEVSTEVAGQVESIHYDVGDFVAKGAVLLELDDEELRLERDRARASLEEALARLGATDPDHLPELEEVTEVRQAQALLDDAERNFNRAEELLKKGVISQAQLDESRTSLEVAVTRHEGTIQQARNLRASIRSFQASLALAEKKLSDATIRSPLPAYIDQRLVSPGEFLRENTALFRLVQSQKLKLIMELPEREAGIVRPGLPVFFSVDAFPGREFEARVTRLSPSVNQSSRTFQVESAVVDPGGATRLKPGFFTRARIIAGKRDVVLVPDRAIYSLSGVTKTFVWKQDHVEERLVTPGGSYEGRIAVQGNVAAGDLVAVTRVSDLSDGQAVQMKEPR